MRALTIVIMEQRAHMVFAGHPAISPMIRLQRVILTDAVENDREKSLVHMREVMLSGPFNCGIFIGGMEGVEDEYKMFIRLHPGVSAFPIASTGAAAAIIFKSDSLIQKQFPALQDEFSYITLI